MSKSFVLFLTSIILIRWLILKLTAGLITSLPPGYCGDASLNLMKWEKKLQSKKFVGGSEWRPSRRTSQYAPDGTPGIRKLQHDGTKPRRDETSDEETHH